MTEGFWKRFSVEGAGRLLDGRQLNTSELGTVVRIDETVGLRLPDGAVLDGEWRAEDTGGEVRNAHVDLYVGDGDEGGRTLESAGIHLKALTVRVISRIGS